MQQASLAKTNFTFPGQTAVYHGKVRDVYTIGDDTLLMVATDRLSAFDVILPKPIPFKGQILNQLAAYFLEKTSDIIPNWLQTVPDPNVSMGAKAEPFAIEMVVRGSLVGHAWREYAAGKRELCGVPMPEGLQEYDAFLEPIVTPTTKAAAGHDENITEAEILTQGLATADEWERLRSYALQLFARGQAMARERDLVLADTKYEFGKLGGNIILIDEIHTPDSSRYFYADSYDAYVGGNKAEMPRQLSKEFVRQWLVASGFSGQTGEVIPDMPDDFIATITERYTELYEKMTGQTFMPADTSDILQRIETNVLKALKQEQTA